MTIYYVDNTITDTNVASATPDFTTYNPATFATDTGTASVFKTIADINAFAALAGDDQVLFRRGQTWREQLTVPASGTSGHPITFGAFGSGDNPKIYGSASASVAGAWTRETGTGTEETGGIFASGIEDEVAAFTTDFTGETKAGTNEISVSTAAGTFNSGAKGGKCTFDGTNANCYVYKTIADQTEVYVRAMVKFNSSFAMLANYNICNVLVLRDATAGQMLCYLNIQCSTTPFNSFKWVAGTSNPTGSIYSGSYGEVALNTWYRVEIRFKQGSGTDGIAQFWLDGVEKGTALTAQTWSTATVDTIRIGHGSFGGANAPNAAAEMYFDDVKADTSAVGAVSLPSLDTDYWYTADLGAVPTAVWRDNVLMTKAANKVDLDAVTKWWPSGNAVYTYSSGATNPVTGDHVYEVAIRDHTVHVNSPDYITIENLILRYANYLGAGGGSALSVNGSTNIAWNNLDVSYNGDTGLQILGNNTTVSGGTFDYNGYCGVDLAGGDNVTVQNAAASYNGQGVGYTGVGFFLGPIEAYAPMDGAQLINLTSHHQAYGIRFSDVANFLIQGCTAHSNTSNGIDSTSAVTVTNLNTGIIEKCYSYGNTSRALILATSGKTIDGVTIRYNLLVGSVRSLDLSYSPTNILVYNNVIYNGSSYGLSIEGADATVTIKNNIIYPAGGFTVHVNTNVTGTPVLDYNGYMPSVGTPLHWKGTNYNFADWKINSSQDANSLNANPLFVSAATGDFRLQSGSPCVNAGVDVSLTTDYTGAPVPFNALPDIGAHECRRNSRYYYHQQ